ncbi:leucine-, glutamate- and lysine-rich protein 1 isoform X2 [Siniperca chuatsi]|uniref:leucine-, glutamate- and lysine-rich protein 1 isoform X2 n=1 Tax=Siniperca chuatsi TaxID=119488 RepID=UPI001CE20357|nr:leucine-, glutamate- and lysine-rich protein 1 isoform X2 [Siniperca chuatsi]
MGDKDRSMEAEQEGENEMKMVLHCPLIYTLPEEIKKMERSETVCCYCGVSYLIFHEFHQLHTRLAQLEAELQELRETAQREKAQREALELGRLEWEGSLHLEMQRQTEEKEKSTREELEERNKHTERALREEFEQKYERKRREMKKECQKFSEEKERQLRRELGDLEAERLRKQREELERKTEEREKVLSDALQKANKNLVELRKYLQQLEERLAIAASTKEEAGQLLGKEKQRGETLRGVCVRQQQALRATLLALRSSGSELTDVRGFLSQLMGAWQAFKSQLLQHSTQVFSEAFKNTMKLNRNLLREELKHSSVEFQKMREEKEHLTQQLMEQKRQTEEQLYHQKDSEKEHREKILRLKGELEEKHERWLSCQRRCDTVQEQLSSWQQREEQMNRKYCVAEEEVTRLREALEKVQQEKRELRTEREILIESHGRALNKMEEDCRQQMASKLAAALEEQRTQNALHLREKMEELRREVELELTIDREKNQLLHQQYQRDCTQLQQKMEEREQELRGLQDELQEERRRRREEEIHQELQRSQQQEALQLSQVKAELQLMTERNAELQEEVELLQETVRRECEERGELTAALSQAQKELLGLRSLASHQGSSRSPPNPMKRNSPPGNKHFHLHSQARVPLTRSSTSPNTLRPSPTCTDKDRGRATDGGGAGRSLESWNRGWVLGGGKRREGTLPRLKASSTVSEVKQKVSLVIEKKKRL